MKTLQQILEEEIPGIDIPQLKKAIKIREKFLSDMRRGYCDVCLKKISIEEARKTTYLDFMYCCQEHGAYRNCFQVELVRKDLGIQLEDNKYSLFDLK